ncbi:MAG TPA: urocanate hydratase [Gaiellaceae bacterium]|nr:urocanate hydratase [Gaiellaceae bacterium]
MHARRGLELRCRGWRQEGLLRMLENTVENAERPAELIVYGGSAQAARDWASFDAIVDCLQDLGDDETLVVQSGKPVARFTTTEAGPRVLIANSNLVGRFATWETFYDLQARGLMMYGQYTAGAWQYIGAQGVLQSTYETLAECARQHFGGSLAGRLVLSAGLGAMGGAQPLAVSFLGGVALVCEVDREHADRRLESGYLEHSTADVDEALTLVDDALAAAEPRSVGLIGNAAVLLPALLAADLRPDVVTDQTAAHDPGYGYVPVGFTVEEAAALRERDPERRELEALRSIRLHVEAMLAFRERGSIVFEYGNAIRRQAVRAGLESAVEIPGYVPLFIRPNFCVGRGPCRWVALSGDPRDVRVIDEALLEHFADDARITSWILLAMERVPHQGLPARTSWLEYEQRMRFGTLVNSLVAGGQVSAPVALSRDHLDAGSVAHPIRETEAMQDGSDAVADWPLLNALLNTAAGADLVAIHQGGGGGMGESISAGMTIVLDGSAGAQERLERVLRTDPGLGVIRHADAGYETARELVPRVGLVAPMLDAGRT